MANWPTNPMWTDPSEINSGNQYEGADGLTADDFNKIINNIRYIKNIRDVELYSIAIQPIFTNGDYVREAEEGKGFNKVTVTKPDTLIPENIRKDIEVAGIIGTLESTKEVEEITTDLDMSQGNQIILPTGDKVISKVIVIKPETLIPENIVKDINIGGITGTFTSDATAVASDILLNKTAYVKGTKVTGTIANYNGSYEDAPKSLEDSTWAEINTASQDGTASSKYSVGDEKTITLTTGEEVTLQILGFNHDDLSSGSGKAGITFGMKNLLATMYPMNSSETSRGGWNSSRMRTSTMATLLSQLPTELKSIVKKVSKKTVKDTDETAVVTSTDSLFLLSRIEVEGESASSAYKNEGTQYAYWAAHSTASERIKKLSNGTGSKEDWWLRSPSVAASYDPGAFYYMYGSANPGSANYSKGVSFAFCV